MFDQVSDSWCRRCRRRVRCSRSSAGETLCGLGAVGWALVVALPLLLILLGATDGGRSHNPFALVFAGFVFLGLGLLPVGILAAAWVWCRRASRWRCSRCGADVG